LIHSLSAPLSTLSLHDALPLSRKPVMKKLCLLGLLAISAVLPALAVSKPAVLDDKPAFINQLLQQMTLQEKVGQLRLISIGADMPRERLAEELAAGNVGGTF